MSDPLEGKGAALGQGPQGTGHRWQVGAASSPWSFSPPAPALRLGPQQAQGFNPTKSQSSWEMERPAKQLRRPGLSWPWLQMPKRPAAPPWLLFSLGRGGQHAGVTSDPLASLLTPPPCLSGVALPAQAAGAPPPGRLGRTLAPGVAGRVHSAQRTRRRRRTGSSSSGKRQRGLGVPPPCHPDVPLSPGLPTG